MAYSLFFTEPLLAYGTETSSIQKRSLYTRLSDPRYRTALRLAPRTVLTTTTFIPHISTSTRAIGIPTTNTTYVAMTMMSNAAAASLGDSSKGFAGVTMLAVAATVGV